MPMSTIAHSDRHDAPRLFDELVPGGITVIDDIVAVLEDTVGEPLVAHELLGILGRVQLGGFGTQKQYGDVRGQLNPVGRVILTL